MGCLVVEMEYFVFEMGSFVFPHKSARYKTYPFKMTSELTFENLLQAGLQGKDAVEEPVNAYGVTEPELRRCVGM